MTRKDDNRKQSTDWRELAQKAVKETNDEKFNKIIEELRRTCTARGDASPRAFGLVRARATSRYLQHHSEFDPVIELAALEYTVLALVPTSRTVPNTSRRITPSMAAYSAMLCP